MEGGGFILHAIFWRTFAVRVKSRREEIFKEELDTLSRAAERGEAMAERVEALQAELEVRYHDYIADGNSRDGGSGLSILNTGKRSHTQVCERKKAHVCESSARVS